MRRWLLFGIGSLLGLVIATVVFVAALVSLVRPTPGGWSHALGIGPWHGEVSVPAVMRMVTHPVVMRALKDRDWRTPQGTLRITPAALPDSWTLSCTACRLPLTGSDVLTLDHVVLLAHRQAQGEWRGDFVLGDAPHAVRGKFGFRFDDRAGELSVQMPDTPLADVYKLFAGAIPEVGRASIEGRVRLRANVKLPQRDLVVEPFIEGFSVTGLGTEALLNATSACPAPRHGFGTWLPRAVIAAEDQRFQEHSGYDLREIASALSQRDTADTTPRGASTLTQQVAKLLYTGDSRTHVRKLRELLYAVELDRTLGKARVLNLYLSMAPWGDGQCGAAAASQHYLHKRVDKLTPMEAAWLASLLHNPERDIAALASSGQVDVKRVAWVIDNLRPLKAAQREAMVDALPGWRPASP
jgi:hypothetical protein